MYIHTGDKLLRFVCVETIVLTPSEDTNIMERNLMKELEEVCHLIIEGEPIKEPEEDPQANQVITRSISRAKEERQGRSDGESESSGVHHMSRLIRYWPCLRWYSR